MPTDSRRWASVDGSARLPPPALLPFKGRQPRCVGRRVKAEAKRQMYLQSTEPAPKLRLVGKLLEMYAARGCRT